MKVFIYISILLFVYFAFTSPVVFADNGNVNILVLKYYPLSNAGTTLDSSITGNGDSLSQVNSWVDLQDQNAVTSLTTSTGYHIYKDTSAISSLHYAIIDTKEFHKSIPLHTLSFGSMQLSDWTDYQAMLTTDVNICQYVDTQNIEEVWIWSYQHNMSIHESNMSMGTNSQLFWNNPTYGNISNSQGANDLPQCNRTYTVYNYNYGSYGGVSNMFHVHGHQMEAVLNWIDANNNDDLWDSFMYPVGTASTINHCGSIHSPPNSVNRSLTFLQPKASPSDTSQCDPSPCAATGCNINQTTNCEGMQDYDVSVVSAPSTCEDWHPDGTGVIQNVSCQNWFHGQCPSFQSSQDDGGLAYFMWWRENIPGLNNNLPYSGSYLRNWWEFFDNFDTALSNGKSLYGNVTPITGTITPTVTTPQQTTKLGLKFILDGIGAGGDKLNPHNTLLNNQIPHTPQRTITASIFDNNNQVITQQTCSISFTNAKDYEGICDVGMIPNGNYILKFQMAPYITTQSLFYTLNANNINQLPQITLITGDVNDDHVLSILDYNILLNCYKDHTQNCSQIQATLSDLNDDGIVDELDLNLFLRELKGSSLN